MKRGLFVFLTFCLLALPLIVAPGEDYEAPESTVEEIKLFGERNIIEWETEGHSENGFKVVWSRTENPTYPTRDGDKYHYYTEPERERDELEAFDGDGTYYIRVCEYLGGKCGLYSNQVEAYLGNDYEEKDDDHKDDEQEDDDDYEDDYDDYEDDEKSQIQLCNNGCVLNEICYPLGHRINNTFCSNNLNLTAQLEEDLECENNFECKSNICVSGECIGEGLITKILDWLKRFFS